MRPYYFLFILAAAFLFSCKKETEEYQTETVSDYVAPQPGKFITYRLDSTITVNFGATIKVNSYQEKYLVDAALSDNLGRPSFRVFRYIRDTAGVQAWKPQGTVFITPTANGIEVIENNLRFLKLAGPIKEDFIWKGNTFLPSNPYSTTYDFGNDIDIDEWEYTYKDVGGTFTYNGKTIPQVVTVEQIDDVSNIPAVADFFGYKSYSIEKYARNIGLVFQELVMLEYQPSTGPRPGYRGFGVKRSIIDHN